MKIVLKFDAAGLDKEYPEGSVWPEDASSVSNGKLCTIASPEELLAFVREALDWGDHVIGEFLEVESVTDSVEERTDKPDWNKLRQLVAEKTMLRPDSVVELIKEWLR